MCLVVTAFDLHADYRLVLVGHRDEFHQRPSADLAWWDDSDDILAGRDLQAGGTWLGIHRSGRMAVVTNYRQPGPVSDAAPSRGLLIPEFLRSDAGAKDFVADLAPRAGAYAGFNLLVYDGTRLAYCHNRPDVVHRPLAQGMYALSNANLDTPWPKLRRSRERVEELLGQPGLRSELLFTALDDREPAADDQLPDTGLGRDVERLLSSPFIVGPVYGTRCTTVVLMDRDGRVRVDERRYAADGATTGRTTVAFQIDGALAPDR